MGGDQPKRWHRLPVCERLQLGWLCPFGRRPAQIPTPPPRASFSTEALPPLALFEIAKPLPSVIYNPRSVPSVREGSLSERHNLSVPFAPYKKAEQAHSVPIGPPVFPQLFNKSSLPLRLPCHRPSRLRQERLGKTLTNKLPNRIAQSLDNRHVSGHVSSGL
jgi:hypothetical protein